MVKRLGLDVSSYQPQIDWKQVATSGVEIVYCKATEGITYKNPRYSSQMHGAEGTGLRVGPYHFYRPKYRPEAQAEFFLERGGWVDSWLPPVLDLEVRDGSSPETILADIAVWMDTVEARVGVPPIIYCSPGFWRALGDPANFHRHPLWVAHYGVQQPSIPGQWPTEAVWGWQYTSSGTVQGIPGRVDLSKWYTDFGEDGTV